MQKMHLRPGFRPDPTGRAHDVPPDSMVGWGEDTPPQTPPHSAQAPRTSRLQCSGLPLHIISGYATAYKSVKLSVCLSVCVWTLGVKQGGIKSQLLHAETCSYAYSDLLMNPGRTSKTRSVWLILWVKIDVEKTGRNKHFQTGWASQLMWCLFKLYLVQYVGPKFVDPTTSVYRHVNLSSMGQSLP